MMSIRCDVEQCGAESSTYVVQAFRGKATSVKYLCSQHSGFAIPAVPNIVTAICRRRPNDELVRCELFGYHVSRETTWCTVVLKGNDDSRWLSFICDSAAGHLIDEIVCQRVQARPRIHSAMLDLLKGFDIRLGQIRYDDVIEIDHSGTVCAVAQCNGSQRDVTLDVRAADAICLAALSDQSILVRKWMLTAVE